MGAPCLFTYAHCPTQNTLESSLLALPGWHPGSTTLTSSCGPSHTWAAIPTVMPPTCCFTSLSLSFSICQVGLLCPPSHGAGMTRPGARLHTPTEKWGLSLLLICQSLTPSWRPPHSQPSRRLMWSTGPPAPLRVLPPSPRGLLEPGLLLQGNEAPQALTPADCPTPRPQPARG